MEIPNLLVKDSEKRIRTIIKALTHSGETDLDKAQLRELKQICKFSKNESTVLVIDECFKYLRKDHSQVRVSVLKLMDYLFHKSHLVRSKILNRIEVFLELTLGISSRTGVKIALPPPKKFASLLQELAVKCLHKWHADYGAGYERLSFTYKHLREHQLVDFGRSRVQTYEDQIQQQRIIEKQERILNQSIQNRLNEFHVLKPEIERLLVQIESLLDILVPSNSEGLLEDTPSTIKSNETTQNHHGIANVLNSVSIEFEPYLELQCNEDNKDVIESLRELKRDLTENKLTKLVAIEKIINKRSEQFLNVLRQIIDLKAKSTGLVMKLSELNIVHDTKGSVKTLDRLDLDSDDNDSDFEDVAPKEDLETYIPKSLRFEYGLEPIDPRELERSNQTIMVDETFDPEAPTPSASGAGEQSLLLPCNARLESGRLCPRRDKIKCPFHGRIIPRDHNGVPIDEAERIDEERRLRKRKPNVPDWQDPDLLRDIRNATGIDLTMPCKGKKSKKGLESKLLNKKICDLSPQQRLQRKLKRLTK